MQPKVHILQDRRLSVAFCPATLAALAVDSRTARALEHYGRHGDLAAAARQSCLAPAKLAHVLAELDDSALPLSPPARQDPGPADEAPWAVGASQGAAYAPDPYRAGPEPGLDRLVLSISSACNLRCRYCYAAGGGYGGAAGRMPRGIALAAVNWALQSFGSIGNIQFFGGEPLTNPRLMVEVCEYFKALQQAGAIARLPRFSLVTNGTLGDERTLALLERYAIGVTISIDGPREINDALRGAGTFDKADRFAAACLANGAIPTDFECTFTRLHLEHDISMVDLVEFFAQRYGLAGLHVVPVALPRADELALRPGEAGAALVAAARHSVRQLTASRPTASSFAQRIIAALRSRTPFEHYCPAGVSTLAVAADGGLYPCFMLAGRDELRIGCFGPDGRLCDNRQPEVRGIIAACDKNRRAECRACWARPLCSGCIGADLIESGDINRRSGCDSMRAQAAAVILEIAALQQDSRAMPISCQP